jgi:MerR family transcriptional regulator, mercuric resistance operon regulatory protein
MDNVPQYGLYPPTHASKTRTAVRVTHAGMTIGRLAREAGVNVETIRYYQRRGLLDEPQRPMGGHRRYPLAALERIAFIRRAQQLGFSLAEVQALLVHADGRNRRATRAIAERKYAVLTAHVAQLNAMRRSLKQLIDKSREEDARDPCPIIAALSKRAG